MYGMFNEKNTILKTALCEWREMKKPRTERTKTIHCILCYYFLIRNKYPHPYIRPHACMHSLISSQKIQFTATKYKENQNESKQA